MRCPTCRQSIPLSSSHDLHCSHCAAILPSALSRRELLARSGVVGLSLLGVGALACATNTSPVTLTPTPTQNNLGLQWALANPWGIEIDSASQAWNAGHVNDVLEGSGGIVVANQNGGVTIITDGGTATSLSHDWDSPDMNTLARGPDGSAHIFAGGASARTGMGALYVTNPALDAPLLAPWVSVPLPNIGEIYKILVIPDARYVVLASKNGLWWSSIPPRGNTTFSWQRANGLTVADGAYWGLASGSPQDNIQVVASAFRPPDGSRGDYGIFYGQWTGGQLQMQRASIPTPANGGVDQTLMYATSLASAPTARNKVYAVSSDAAGSILAVLYSNNSGRDWTRASANLLDASGHVYRDPTSNDVVSLAYFASDQGRQWNNCIGVSATDMWTFAIGWRNGPFLSQDGGGTFKFVTEGTGGHQDQHAILFTATDGGRMYVASDGGVHMANVSAPPTASGRDIAFPFTTRYNQKLANLQFLGPSGRQYWGAFAVSYSTAGLIAGGLQDNDNVFSVISGSNATPWQQLYRGADGGPMIFLRTGGVMQADIADNYAYGRLSRDTFSDNAIIPIRRAKPGGPTGSTGFRGGVVEIVNAPAYRNNAGQLMYAVAGTGADIYGLFANTDGGDIHWDYLTSLPIAQGQGITAISSGSGAKIFAGVNGNGQIYVFAPSNPTNFTTSTGLPTTFDSFNRIFVLRIIVQSDSSSVDAFAVYNDFSTGPATGQVYRTTNGSSWNPVGAGLPGGPYYCLETNWQATPKTLYVATDAAVFASVNNGNPWFNVSNGLPARAHCSDLRYVTEPDGTHYLYLATFGWSVWRTRIR
jgi:hypothetical protein